ncbi:biotin synthase [Clostridium sp. MSTE9]|uniref:biotin synthase BioB n=1 Tax=Clostridium sp. (strain MSTE9) TaxID=1105031 RepID=UPI00026F2CD2|nr:biotin synthase BioB [Clostridium sp. MSTE9]EJF39926.1 biotin synthase [Clostridium sp. MSTE9]
MSIVQIWKEKILSGGEIDRPGAEELLKAPLEELCEAANEIREKLNGNTLDTCSILNGKSGLCTENCKYCAQARGHKTGVEEYPLLTVDRIVEEGLQTAEAGVDRFSVVTSGVRVSDAEVDVLCRAYAKIHEQSDIQLCASHGLINYEQFLRLKEAGITRIHNNLETSRRFFPRVCTTHTYDDKIETIRAAQKAGLEICSGGIIGMGEEMSDRLDMAFELRDLGVESIPVNVLMAIPGTPLQDQPLLPEPEILRTIALFRLINPTANIRLAGGRNSMTDCGRLALHTGANASITGNMLTTSGNTVEEDFEMFTKAGFQLRRQVRV